MFKRLIDLHLDQWKTDPYRKPLLLRGARQVGKTYAVRRLGQTFEYFVEINIDIIEVLTESSNPRRYWSDLKIKLAESEGVSQLYEKIVQLKLQSKKIKRISWKWKSS